MLGWLLEPFSLGFMRRALAGCFALSVAGPPLGVFLVLRRMSLMSDVLQHGILPGLAIGAAVAGLSVAAMGAGGFVAGLAVALLAAALARATGGKEDSQLAATYLVALALGVAIVSRTRAVDLAHLLFGSVLAVDDPALLLMASVATVALLGLAVIWRPLILDSFDAEALLVAGRSGAGWHPRVPGPGGALRGGRVRRPRHADVRRPGHAAGDRGAALVAAPGRTGARVGMLAVVASLAGLILSYDMDLPTGPAIVLMAGAIWLGSLGAGPYSSLLRRWLRRPHLAH